MGDTDSAAVLYRLLVPWAAFNAVDVAEGIRGSVSRYLGILAATTWSASTTRSATSRTALAMNERMGARPWLAHTQEDYARMLLARDDPGDRERAQELLDQALATYRELGMESYVWRVPRSSPSESRLTPEPSDERSKTDEAQHRSPGDIRSAAIAVVATMQAGVASSGTAGLTNPKHFFWAPARPCLDP